MCAHNDSLMLNQGKGAIIARVAIELNFDDILYHIMPGKTLQIQKLKANYFPSCSARSISRWNMQLHYRILSHSLASYFIIIYA
jgi:hypothetical protein